MSKSRRPRYARAGRSISLSTASSTRFTRSHPATWTASFFFSASSLPTTNVNVRGGGGASPSAAFAWAVTVTFVPASASISSSLSFGGVRVVDAVLLAAGLQPAELVEQFRHLRRLGEQVADVPAVLPVLVLLGVLVALACG